MKIKANFKKIHVKEVKNKFKILFDGIYSGEQTYNKKIIKWFINTYKIFVASSKKFLEDDCLTKASSIAYNTIISLIPTLTVVLTFYSIFSGVGDKKEEVFARITSFMVEHNIKLNIDPILETISSLIENAGKIGGIGAAILIFSATNVLRTLDKSLNSIWNIKTKRTIFLKIIYFWTALSLGPILVISGSTLANQITSMLSSPNHYAAGTSGDGKIWAVGNKANIIYSNNAEINFTTLSINNIDFDNQQVYNFDAANKIFSKQEFKVEEIEYAKSEFRDIQFIDNSGWIIGKNGLLLFTNDNGKSWKLRKYGSLGFNDIYMLNKDRGFIAADNGYLLFTNNGWQQIEVKEWKDITSNLKSISFFNNHGIITGERGLIITTKDGGETWDYAVISEARNKKRYVNINKIYFLSESNLLLTCNDGIILFSTDAGKTWEKKKYYDENYTTAYFINNLTGYVAGGKGILISTNDGGQNWRKQTLSISNINTLLVENNSLWALGDNGMVLKSTNNGETWNGIKGKNIILYLINFFAPFLYIWLLFLLIYMFFPNTKVPFKPAALGAAFTGTVWVIFILLFEVYVKAFAKGSLAIYGALAAIPLFLLMVYTSVLIVLYGAEVSFTLMHPHTYLKLKKSIKYKKDIHLYYGIFLLYFIYKKFETGKGAVSFNELLKSTSNNDEEVTYFIEIFKKENLIVDTQDGNLAPANSSKNILLADIIALIHDVTLFVPGVISKKDKLKKFIDNIFDKMKKSKEDIVREITLADVIEKTI